MHKIFIHSKEKTNIYSQCDGEWWLKEWNNNNKNKYIHMRTFRNVQYTSLNRKIAWLLRDNGKKKPYIRLMNNKKTSSFYPIHSICMYTLSIHMELSSLFIIIIWQAPSSSWTRGKSWTKDYRKMVKVNIWLAAELLMMSFVFTSSLDSCLSS